MISKKGKNDVILLYQVNIVIPTSECFSAKSHLILTPRRRRHGRLGLKVKSPNALYQETAISLQNDETHILNGSKEEPLHLRG